MDRRAVTTYFKANGAKIDYYDKESATYLFPTEEAVYECRDKIPYVTLFHGPRSANEFSIVVFFNKLKEVNPVDAPKQEPGKIFDFQEFEQAIVEAGAYYEKRAPTVEAFLDSMFIRAHDDLATVTLAEISFLKSLREDGQWMQPNVAANNCYKLMTRLGMDTTGQAGF